MTALNTSLLRLIDILGGAKIAVNIHAFSFIAQSHSGK